ncbi:nucleotidyl transferase AbiEii/AbiGii toxin family protein [Methyloceanibacter sp. wino2]|uniref:nucleotidyl transferase AbiEii/AbiGii toxin family protein n=1 Tax=Methyloceanibacter sp. wino2 TaxID=2170729 RepID=UPI000D3E3084|nr:nucleotidyl transferase AbiEii/AbiGii toxin family protein [Methyloceanibacter sp. wino2]
MSAESEGDNEVVVDIAEWVEKAKSDPEAYLERQATEVFLTALGIAEPFSHQIFLKGGILMGVVYQSPRQTGDIDFTTIMEPTPEIGDQISNALDAAFPRAAAELGYPDLLCAVQTSKYRPAMEKFPTAEAPALLLKIGYARRGSPQERHFQQGRAINTLDVDISFREPVRAIQIVKFTGSSGRVHAYSLFDLIAEKLRALLQQELRNRFRRQDIYDLDALLNKFALDDDEKQKLHETLLEKCAARKINPNEQSLSQPEIVRRAKQEWDTLGQELAEVPDFDDCFSRVDAFYRSLPWKRD